MANKKLSGNRIVSTDFKPSRRDWGLSGTLGLMFCFSASPVFASQVTVPTPPVVTHTPITHTTHITHTTLITAPPSTNSATTNNSSTSNSSTNTPPNTSTTVNKSSTTHAPSHASTASAPSLNLQSSSPSYTLGTLGNFKTVTIDVGGKIEKVSSTTKLTSAELLAADQALYVPATPTTHALTINSQGVATGGTFTLNGQTLQGLDTAVGGVGSLFIPSNVTLADGVKTLNIAGDLTNYGTIAVQSGGSTIHATNISNAYGATISGGGTAQSPASLTLTADQTLANAGTIKSTGDLTINATVLQNTAPPGMTPTISAGHNLNLNVPSVSNSGTMVAKGDLNLTSGQSINVQQSASGNLIAGGNINFRDPSYTGSGNVNIGGGNLLSQQLNITAPVGTANLVAGNVTGVVNATVGEIHTDTEASTLKLGNLNILGDPEFYNQGNIQINGSVKDTNGVPLAFVASGNITTNGGSLVTSGGDLTLIAGASFTTSDGSAVSAFPPNWNTILTINGGSSTGGFIDLTGFNGGGAPISAVSTAAVSPGNGGNVTMVAYAGSGAGSGTISIPTSVTINTNGIDLAPGASPTPILSLNGNVQLIAGATGGLAISIGNITADNATGGGGVISLQTGFPVVAGATRAGIAYPYQIVNGEPYGSFSSSGTGAGNITFNTINGFIAHFMTNEVGGSFTVSTSGSVGDLGDITDQGINVTAGAPFVQNTVWTNGGGSINVNNGGFTQTTNGSIQLLGVGGVFNINANSNIDIEGQNLVSGGLSPATLNITPVTNGTVYVGALTGATANITADILNFNNVFQVLVNGSITNNTNNVPTGSGNVSFNNPGGSVLLSGTGTVQNTGTFTMTAGTTATISNLIAPNVNNSKAPNGWVFNAPNIVLPYRALAVSADPAMTGNGGTVSLTYTTLTYPTNGSNPTPFLITANGRTGGMTDDGGTVTITTHNTNTQAIGGATGDFAISVNSGGSPGIAAGGTINFTSGGGLIVNPNDLSATGVGTGGTLNFTVATNLSVLGSLNVTPTGGAGAQNFGSLNFTIPNGIGAFVVGTTTPPGNGVEGSLTGNVTINNPAGITVLAGSSIIGNAINLNALGINNQGTILGALVGKQTTSTVTLNTPAILNGTNGEIGAALTGMGTSSVTVNGGAGSLAITGQGKWDNTYAYNFQAMGNINMGELFSPPAGPQANPTFTTLSIISGSSMAGGIIGIATDALTTNVNPAAAITLSASQIAYGQQSTNPFTLTANGSVTGGIVVNLTGTTTQTIGTGAGDYALQVVTGGSAAGQISFTTGGGLIVHTDAASLNNNNGNLTLAAGTNLAILGPINQGKGDVTLTSTGSGVDQFVVNTTGAPANGIEGNITGATVTITNPLGATILTGGTITSTQSEFKVPLFINNGTLIAPTEIQFASPSSLVIAGSGTYMTTKEYNVSGINISFGPLFATPTSNVFDELVIDATGAINFNSTNALQTSGAGANSINITATGLFYKNQSSTPLTLNAGSVGGGGAVSVTLMGTAPLTVGGGAGQLTINTSETAGGGAGTGSVTVVNGGALTINPNFLIVNTPADKNASTNMTFTSMSGALLVSTGNTATGWAPTLLGPNGTLMVTANAPSDFVVGVLTGIQSGFNTSVPITGGTISITNNTNGIYLANTDILQSNKNSTLTLTASGEIFGASGLETIIAPTITLTSTGSTVGTSTNPLIVNAPATPQSAALTVSSPIGVYVTDNTPGFFNSTYGVNTLTLSASAPIVSIANNNKNAPLIDIPSGLPTSTTVTISAPGQSGGSAQGIQTEMTIGNGAGVVTLNAGTGTIYENPTLGLNSYPNVVIQGSTVALTANDVLSKSITNTNLETVETFFTYNGSMTGSHQVVNQSFFPTSLNATNTTNFNYLSQSEVVINGAQTTSGNYHLTSWGQILVDAPINGGGPSDITLQTVSGGYITSLNNSVVTGHSVNLDSDYGNFVNLGVNGGLSTDTTGIVSLTSTATTQLDSNTASSFTFVSSGQVLVHSSISTTNGNIYIQSGASSSVLFDLTATLHSSSTQPGQGIIQITVGPFPTSVLKGPALGGSFTVNQTGGGLVYTASSAFPNDSISASGGSNVLNASGRNIIFNANGNSGNILFSSNATITADPPVTGDALPVVSNLPVATTPGAITLAPMISISPPAGSDVCTCASILPANAGGGIQLNPTTLGTTSIQAASSLSSLSGRSTIDTGRADANANPNTTTNTLSTISAQGLSGAALSNNSPATYAITANLSNPATSSAAVTSGSSSLSNATNLSSLTLASLPTSTLSLPSLSVISAPGSGVSAAVVSGSNVNALANNTVSNALYGAVSEKHHSYTGVQPATGEPKFIDQGAVILGPDHATTVGSKFGKVSVAAKSLVVLVATEKCFSVYNFHDDAKDSVVVTTASGRPIDVYPGQHVTITNVDADGFENVNPALFIPHRGLTTYDTGGGQKVFLSQFDIRSAIRGIEPLRGMLMSQEHDKQKMAKRVFKTVAVLQVMSGSHSDFQLMLPQQPISPAVTAYSH